jgi:hypothetical protein
MLVEGGGGRTEIEVLGFIIAVAPPDKDFVWVLQAWSAGQRMQDSLESALDVWMGLVGREKVRIELRPDGTTKLSVGLELVGMTLEGKIGERHGTA